MKRFSICLASLALGLMVASAAQAAGKKGGGNQGSGSGNGGSSPAGSRILPAQGNGGPSTPLNRQVLPINQGGKPSAQKNIVSDKKYVPAQGYQEFLTKSAKKYSFGYCYHGGHHCHWVHQCWSPHYGCTIYWCPYACCYFYWCAPHCCWYPVSYCPTGIYAY